MEYQTISVGKKYNNTDVKTLDNLARLAILSMKWIIHIDRIPDSRRVSKTCHF